MADQIQQGTPEWFALRLGKATGSNFDACLAKGKGTAEATTRRNYRVKLALERLNGAVISSNFKSAAMEQGTEREPYARLAYENATGRLVEEVPFVPHKFLMAGVSPDGLVGDDGLLEIKCPSPATHWEYLKLTTEPPAEYKWQVYGQMLVTGRKWCDFASYSSEFPPELQLHVVRVNWDDAVISELDAGLSKFLHDVDTTLREMKEMVSQRVQK